MTKTSILKTEIYPKLYQCASEVFPEFNFKTHGNAWIARAKLDIDGTPTDAPGKVYLYQDKPHRLWSHKQGAAVLIWHYLSERENLTGKDLLKYMADLAGVTLSSPGEERPPPQKGISQSLLETALPWVVQKLWQSEDAAPVRDYLTEQRGYTEGECRAMGLGFISDRSALAAYLKDASRTDRDKQIAFFLRLKKPDSAVPFTSTHRLIIPVWGESRQLIGYCFRATEPGATPKYLNTYGLEKGRALFAYPPGQTQLVIVEGILDAAIAQAKGFDNVVSLNGTSLSLRQLEALQTQGIEAITLCLDSDKAGAAARKKIFRTLLENDLALRLYVATLPDGIKDPDALLCRRGPAALQTVLDTAQGFGQYLGETLTKLYAGEVNPTARKRDALIHRCVAMDSRFHYHPDRLDFRAAIAPALTRFGLSVVDYEQTVVGMLKASENSP
ncbi:MAG: toprim domain-containing protein [Cyanobacteria bacterium P01_D01_bin.56]